MSVIPAKQPEVEPQPLRGALPRPVLPLRFGPVTLETNLMLAPIAGWCDLAWRITVRELGGVGLASTDLLSPKGLLISSETSFDLARTNDLDKPVGMQLYGCDPQVMADGARWCVDHGATVVDINMGCPVDKVTKKNGGSKLMCDIGGAARMAEAIRKAMPDSVPLTAKMRLGWDEAAYCSDCAPRLACELIDVGVAGITVHGRTTEMRFKGECRREGIRRVVEAVAAKTGRFEDGGVPVIGNGDVKSAEDAASMMADTGCAGVMIGRGAFARPWVFAEAWHLLTTGAAMPPIAEERKVETIRSWYERMREFRDDRYALHKLHQKMSWLGKDINGGHCKALKVAVREAMTPAAVHAALDGWLAGSQTRDAGSPDDPPGRGVGDRADSLLED